MDIPGYKIHKKIGEGAMASVYLADQESLGRQVALKVLAPALACQQDFTARFLNEGKIIAYLDHPQIVNVHDLGSHRHHYYLAMEFLPGGTLGRRIKTGMRTKEALGLIIAICRSLDFAHRHGVIHRDIKPQNILFRNDNTPVLTDFGIARLMNGDPGLTIPGRTVGSPSYMSPEQICGRKIDERADLYAMGILFFEMLTNRLPYQSDQFVDIALMHKTAPIPALPDELAVFQPILDRLLAKEPEHRYASAREFIKALAQIEPDQAVAVIESEKNSAFPTHQVHKMDAGKLHFIENRNNQADEATQPEFEALRGTLNAKTRPNSKNQSTMLSNQSMAEMQARSSGPTKGISTWKKIWASAGAVLTIAVCFYFYESMAIIDKSTSSVPKPTPVAVRVASLQTEPVLGKNRSQPNQQILIEQQRNDSSVPSEPSTHDQHAMDQKIEDLLARAQTQLAGYRLRSPAGDNCYETYQQILALDSSNQAAESLLKQIGGAYRKLAMANQAQGQFQKGLINLAKGLALLPEDKALLALQVELKSELAMQTRKLQQQAREIEQQKRIQDAEQLAMEKRRQAEIDFEVQRLKEVERELRAKQRAEAKKQAETEVKNDVEKPKATEKDAGRRNRLFGTF